MASPSSPKMASSPPSPKPPFPPIPLRPFLMPLIYHRALHDPSYAQFGLLSTSLNDETVTGGFLAKNALGILHAKNHIISHVKQLPDSILRAPNPSPYPPSVFRIHPDATALARSLSHRDMDTLYHQTIAGNTCFESARLLKKFFDLFPEDQKFSVVIDDEEFLLTPSNMRIRVLKLRNFITHLSITKHTPEDNLYPPFLPAFWETGIAPGWHCNQYLFHEPHCVVYFPSATPYKHIVVDLSRIQYGDAGRGSDGELYFVGTLDTYLEEMKGIAEEVVSKEVNLTECKEGDGRRLDGTVRDAFWAWEKREEMGWCEYCGRPRELEELIRCPKCGDREVGWCCEEHLEYGSRLHARSCQSEVGEVKGKEQDDALVSYAEVVTDGF